MRENTSTIVLAVLSVFMAHLRRGVRHGCAFSIRARIWPQLAVPSWRTLLRIGRLYPVCGPSLLVCVVVMSIPGLRPLSSEATNIETIEQRQLHAALARGDTVQIVGEDG